MSSAGPAQPTAMRRLCGCRETGHIREDPEGGGHPSARERSARSALAAASAAAGRKPPPRVPWGMVERRVGQHALRGATLQSTQASQNRDEDRLTGWSYRGPEPRERCTTCTPAEERWTPA